MKKLFLSSIMLILFVGATAQNWNQTAKIVATDRDADNRFGSDVSISGDYAIAGAPFDDKDINGENEMGSAGSAYFYKKDENGNWVQTQKVTASDRMDFALFGYAVSIDGNLAIIGAYQSSQLNLESEPVLKAGSAYIFKRDEEGIWNLSQKLVASDMTASAAFGFAVSIKNNYAVIGAFSDDEGILPGQLMPDAGSAYVFEKNVEDEWQQKQKIVASDRYAGDMFGVAVDISGDNIIVGAWLESEDASSENTLSEAGSAYVFHRNENGSWKQIQKITASDRDPNDNFGVDVAIDDDYAIVGAFYEGDVSVEYAGAAYLFEKSEDNTWNEVQKVVAPDREK